MAAPAPVLPGDVPEHASPNCYYCDSFSDATKDPFNGNYAQVLQPYGIALANQNAATPPAQVPRTCLRLPFPECSDRLPPIARRRKSAHLSPARQVQDLHGIAGHRLRRYDVCSEG